MKISIVLPKKGKPTLTFTGTVVIDPEGDKHEMILSEGDYTTLMELMCTKEFGSIWYTLGVYTTVTDDRGKVLVNGYVRRNKSDTGFIIREDDFHMPWLKAFRLDPRGFGRLFKYRTGWWRIEEGILRFFYRWVRHPITVSLRFLRGLPSWWVRFTQNEPPCPHCYGSGIQYGDSLDEFAEYTCGYCKGKKHMRKCTCNRFGLYPIWGKRFRKRENCPTCSRTNDHGWLIA